MRENVYLQMKMYIYKYCNPIKTIKYKNVAFDHCVFSDRVLFQAPSKDG